MQFVLKKYQLFGVSYLLRPLEQMTPVLWMFLATLCPIHNCVASVNPLSQSPIMCQFWHHPEYPDHHPVYHPVHHHCSSSSSVPVHNHVPVLTSSFLDFCQITAIPHWSSWGGSVHVLCIWVTCISYSLMCFLCWGCVFLSVLLCVRLYSGVSWVLSPSKGGWLTASTATGGGAVTRFFWIC